MIQFERILKLTGESLTAGIDSKKPKTDGCLPISRLFGDFPKHNTTVSTIVSTRTHTHPHLNSLAIFVSIEMTH